jgi:hypothetical protein
MAARGSTRWAKYLNDANQRWRPLYGRADSKLIELSQEERAGFVQFFTRFPPTREDARALAEVRWLLDPTTSKFIIEELPSLLRSASRSSVPRREVSRGRLRGRLMVDRTLLMRAQGRLSETDFFTTRREGSWDTPENRLLKLFLVEVRRLLTKLLGNDQRFALSRRWKPIVDEIDTAMRTTWMRDVQSAHTVNPAMVAGARRSREPRYAVVLDLYERLVRALGRVKWDVLMQYLAAGWLDPLSDDDQFELVVLFSVLDQLREVMGEPENVAFIVSGRSSIATFRISADSVVRVFFDQSPIVAIRAESEYVQLLRRYGRSPQPRRPDILLVKEQSGVPIDVLMIECKDSKDDAYLRESVYRAFGYVHDFKKCWESTNASNKVIIVAPEFPSAETSSMDQSVLIIGMQSPQFLTAAIDRFLKVTANTPTHR